jgi:hypothetical protein
MNRNSLSIFWVASLLTAGNRPKTAKALGGIGVARCVEAATRKVRQCAGIGLLDTV